MEMLDIMKTDAEGIYTDFCCEEMNLYSTAARVIKFDPFYKKFDLDEEQHRACIYTLTQGQSIIGGRKVTSSGRGMVPITYCCFCGQKITFEQK